MNIAVLDNTAETDFAADYLRNGVAILRQVSLPSSFMPSETDVVFLKIDEMCEVYIGTNTTYQGTSSAWREIQRRPEAAGRSRLVVAVKGDYYSGLNSFQRLLKQAGQAPTTCAAPSGIDGSEAYPPAAASKRQTSPAMDVDQLTDLSAVHEAIAKQARSVLIDETHLFSELTKTIRGQDNALRLLSRRVCRHLAKEAPRRPLTVFSVGPTGVGKTESAKTLPKAIRALVPDGEAYAFLRLDMTEYQERHRLSQLAGSPQSYVGYGDGAQLPDALAANPRTVVVFDEIEKAHPDIMKFLMNAMDAGRLSTAAPTAAGREIDCRKAIFIFTSNIDASGILTELEQRGAFDESAVVDEVCRNRLKVAGIAPELVGRISCFLVFQPLSPEVQAEVVTLAIVNVGREYGVEVGRIEPTVIIAIMEATRSANFGARPFEYFIEEMLGLCFAEAVSAELPKPVEVQGPPFACASVQVAVGPETADRESSSPEANRD